MCSVFNGCGDTAVWMLGIKIKEYIYIYIYIYTEWPKKRIHSLLINIFGISYDSVWMPMVATSNTYIESKIQGHLSYQFCFSINTVVTIIK